MTRKTQLNKLLFATAFCAASALTMNTASAMGNRSKTAKEKESSSSTESGTTGQSGQTEQSGTTGTSPGESYGSDQGTQDNQGAMASPTQSPGSATESEETGRAATMGNEDSTAGQAPGSTESPSPSPDGNSQ